MDLVTLMSLDPSLVLEVEFEELLDLTERVGTSRETWNKNIWS